MEKPEKASGEGGIWVVKDSKDLEQKPFFLERILNKQRTLV